MKRTVVLAVFVMFVLAVSAFGQAGTVSPTATLAVSATVTPSIGIVFNKDTNGVTVTNPGTSAATIAFGSVSAYGTLPANVTQPAGSPTATNFTVQTPVDAYVTATNSTSATYTLTAKLLNSDTTNTWAVNNATVTNTTAGTATATGAYKTNVPVTVAITIPFSSTAALLNISNTLNFVATTN